MHPSQEPKPRYKARAMRGELFTPVPPTSSRYPQRPPWSQFKDLPLTPLQKQNLQEQLESQPPSAPPNTGWRMTFQRDGADDPEVRRLVLSTRIGYVRGDGALGAAGSTRTAPSYPAWVRIASGFVGGSSTTRRLNGPQIVVKDRGYRWTRRRCGSGSAGTLPVVPSPLQPPKRRRRATKVCGGGVHLRGCPSQATVQATS